MVNTNENYIQLDFIMYVHFLVYVVKLSLYIGWVNRLLKKKCLSKLYYHASFFFPTTLSKIYSVARYFHYSCNNYTVWVVILDIWTTPDLILLHSRSGLETWIIDMFYYVWLTEFWSKRNHLFKMTSYIYFVELSSFYLFRDNGALTGQLNRTM